VATYILLQSSGGRLALQSGTGLVLLQSNEGPPRTGGPFTQFRPWTITGMRYGDFSVRGGVTPTQLIPFRTATPPTVDAPFVPSQYLRFPYAPQAAPPASTPVLSPRTVAYPFADAPLIPPQVLRFPYVPARNPVIAPRTLAFPFPTDPLITPHVGKVLPFPAPPPPAANPVLSFVLATYPFTEARPFPAAAYLPFPWVSTTPPAPANPVIPYIRGQWLGDTAPLHEARAAYHRFPFLSTGVSVAPTFRPMITQHDILHLTDIRG
jgi:hypothetical protein